MLHKSLGNEGETREVPQHHYSVILISNHLIEFGDSGKDGTAARSFRGTNFHFAVS